jgi:cysteinyl-tRNA synthetase
MHVGFVNVNEEKMSKSLGNFFTIREVLESYDGETLRYFILSSHYRSPLNFSDANLDNAKNAITKLYTSIRGLKSSTASTDEISQRLDYEQRFDAALDDDFNTPIAISILFEISKQINLEKEKDVDFASALSGLLVRLGGYLGILQNNPEDFLKHGVQLSDEEIDQKIKDRNLARSEKDFALSDQIRDELEAHGIILEDSAEGTLWRRK